MIDLRLNTELATKILTGFIHTEVTRVGFNRAVIGLSGGVDSAVSCFLAAMALGSENVLAVCMPYRNSSSESIEHAQLVINQLGVQDKTIDITEIVDPLFELLSDTTQLRRGNIMARARMAILFDQSESFSGLVMGTGNKTEILLGYTTLYGDSACAMNPIGDLYKTQIRQLAVSLGVPDVIVKKPPSADLWPGQTDEAELGFTYEQVDKLLYLLIDQRYSPTDCVSAGFSESFVMSVIERVRRNHFKHVLPPIAKLTNRTIGYDFLYLRDWGT